MASNFGRPEILILLSLIECWKGFISLFIYDLNDGVVNGGLIQFRMKRS
jgi:hypothetical protein